MDITTTELIGYAASAVLLLSFTRKDLKKLRWFNSLGCLLFVVYGFMLDSMPVVITNLAIIAINAYYLFFKVTEDSSSDDIGS
ncbi:MAG: uroporphyrinogen decarboxylase [Nonlabens sp.]|uniref:uroporphyrinogen decarboxylase n=1 Tax=Nonlabens sp. TaxID=1888209 RepID=UPI003EF4CC9F